MPSSKRVLVTRFAHQGSELAERLRTLGLEPVLIPAIEMAEPSSFGELDSALARLGEFDWLIFTSANAVAVFADRRPARRGAPVVEKNVNIAAIGPATAQALQAIGLTPNLVPAQAVAESLSEALLSHACTAEGASTRFLLIRAEEAREHLPDTLRAAGADVTVAPAYRTRVPETSVKLLRDLFSSHSGAGAVTFTSSSTARNLVTLCESAGVALPEETLRVSIGPITSRTLRELGLPPHAEAAEATVSSLAETVQRLLG